MHPGPSSTIETQECHKELSQRNVCAVLLALFPWKRSRNSDVNAFRLCTAASHTAGSPGTIKAVPKHAIWYLTPLAALKRVTASAYLAHPVNVVLATMTSAKPSTVLSSVLHSALEMLRPAAFAASFSMPT